MISGSKWIVTTGLFTAEELERLCNSDDWSLLIIADHNDQLHPKCSNLFRLPLTKESKLPGFLFAVERGAEWILDASEEFSLADLGQFDYSSPISGLRYILTNGDFSTYGSLVSKENGKMISCREMERPAIQFEFENKEVSTTPPIVLEKGVYSIGSTRSTLYHYSAFFTMAMSRSVSMLLLSQYFLHLIGERVGLYPITNGKTKNSFYNRLNQNTTEHFLGYLSKWECKLNRSKICMENLMTELVRKNLLSEEVHSLIRSWMNKLESVGYTIPLLVKDGELYSLRSSAKYANCRDASLNLGDQVSSVDMWATKTVNSFGEILDWCNGSVSPLVSTPKQFLNNYKKAEGVYQKNNTVLVLVNNYPWHSHNLSASTVGLLQRLYGPFFKLVVFCGTWTKNFANHLDELPIVETVNYVNILMEEMQDGHRYGYCVSKIRDLRLRNVEGFYFVSDDTVFNIWNRIPQNGTVINPAMLAIDRSWKPKKMILVLDLIERKYKDNVHLQNSWKEYQNGIYGSKMNGTARDHFLRENRAMLGDFFYVPTKHLNVFADLMEVLVEAEVDVETSVAKILDGINYDIFGEFRYFWEDRPQAFELYNSSYLGVHPIKINELHTNTTKRNRSNRIEIDSYTLYLFMHLIPLALLFKSLLAEITPTDNSCSISTSSGLKYALNSDSCSNVYSLADCQAIYQDGRSSVSVLAGENGDRPVKCFSLDNAPNLNEEVRKIATSTCAKTCGYCCLTADYNCQNAAAPKTNCATLSVANCTNPTLIPTLAKDCPSTCGLCRYAKCVDSSASCMNWIKNGFCSSPAYTPAQKKQYCAKGCNLC